MSADAYARSVTLRGGPADGLDVTVTYGQSLLLDDPDDATRVARYRPSRDKSVYTFRGFDRVVVRIPAPGDGA